MKTSFIAAAFAIAMGVLATGCAGTGSAGNAGSSAATPTSGSGVTVFGTIDASVSGYKNSSSAR